MKNEIISAEIKNLTEVIKEQQEAILSYDGKIPQIEMDILMGNVRKLYECLTILNKQERVSIPEKVTAPIENKIIGTDELIAQVVAEETLAVEDVNVVEEINSVADVIAITEPEAAIEIITPIHTQPELLVAVAENVAVENHTVENTESSPLASERTKQFTKPANKPQQMASLFDEPVTVAEKYKGAPSVYDKISATKQDNSLAEKLLKNPVSDLKKSIGINEKFSFINELFDGDLNSYNENIDKLNNCQNYNQAVEILENELASKYNWSGESESFIKLRVLIERRFMA